MLESHCFAAPLEMSEERLSLCRDCENSGLITPFTANDLKPGRGETGVLRETRLGDLEDVSPFSATESQYRTFPLELWRNVTRLELPTTHSGGNEYNELETLSST